jgi:ParB family transcriptional regulator, chromosome partitioning protein
MKVSIDRIRPNPFQVRKHIDRERLQALADEMKELGHWGSLRARKQGTYYELCFGHRRLAALKLAKIKDVDLEVVDLSDDEMATQALVENLQREGLTDTEKAKGIKDLIDRFERDGQKNGHERVQALMGLSRSRINELLSLLGLSAQSKQFVASGQISGSTAIRAKNLGGEEMIATAVKHGLPQKTLQQIQQELTAIPDKKIREKVMRAVVAGRVRDPESVRLRERQLRAEQTGPAPRDLRLVIRTWTKTMQEWAKQLDQAAEYIDYIEGDAEGAATFKTATRELIDKLKRFL